MQTYKLYIDVLYTVTSALEADIEIEAFGHQQFELVGNQLNMSDIITVQAINPMEAIIKAREMVKDQYAASQHIGFYSDTLDGGSTYGYLDIIQYQACHIHFADEEMDERLEDILEDLNAPYYMLTE